MTNNYPESSDAIENLYPEFSRQLVERLRAGARTYGDASFSLPPSELLREMQQEAMDITGWGFVLWCRLEALIRAIERVEATYPARPGNGCCRPAGGDEGAPVRAESLEYVGI